MFSRAGRFFIQKNKLAKFLSVIESRNFISTRSKPEAINIPIPYGHISGELWNGSSSEMPILAIHGWLDNAGTWDTLLPLINSTAPILTIDLPGHGLSSPRPAGSVGSYLENVLILDRVINHFKWEKIILLGHSMGAHISTLYAGTVPDKVLKVILIDGGIPNNFDCKDFPGNTAITLKRLPNAEAKLATEPPKYSYNFLLDKLVTSYNGSITIESGKCLLRRGSKKQFEDYSFTYSPLERVPYPLSLTFENVCTYCSRINCDVLVVTYVRGADYGPRYMHTLREGLKVVKQKCKSFELIRLDGTHHMHLNDPASVADALNRFFTGYPQDKVNLIDFSEIKSRSPTVRKS